MTEKLKTWPERIWLQHGDDEVPPYPGAGSETTWCEDSINHNDIEYVRADLVRTEPAGSAEPTVKDSFTVRGSAGKAGEREALLRRAANQLTAWHRQYGENNPEWLPPAGDVRLLEDIYAALSQAQMAQSGGERIEKGGV